jgi:hypothetical protein
VDELTRVALAAADAAAAIHRRDRGRVVLEAASAKGRADYVSLTDMDAPSASPKATAHPCGWWIPWTEPPTSCTVTHSMRPPWP